MINLKLSAEINKVIHMPKYNQLLMDRYSDMIFLIRQFSEPHLKFGYTWNHSKNQEKQEEFSQQFIISFSIQQKPGCQAA